MDFDKTEQLKTSQLSYIPLCFNCIGVLSLGLTLWEFFHSWTDVLTPCAIPNLVIPPHENILAYVAGLKKMISHWSLLTGWIQAVWLVIVTIHTDKLRFVYIDKRCCHLMAWRYWLHISWLTWYVTSLLTENTNAIHEHTSFFFCTFLHNTVC